MAPLGAHTVPLSNLLSTRTLPSSIISHTAPWKRQSTIFIIPTGYDSLYSSDAPGTIAGIVLGSVAGFLLLLWLIYTCFGQGGFANGGATYDEYDTSVVGRGTKSRGTRSRRSGTTRRQSGTVVEEMRSAPPERIIVEERRERARSAVRSGISEHNSEDDEVVVIEEHESPPRRSKSKHRHRESESGYRNVDPMAYGGGDRPFREMGSRRGSMRR